ncbi:MAG: hypothetical protein ACXVWF_07060 [Actinomycetota bacterium]
MSVTYADDEPNGLAELLGGLIAQNLARDPGRRRFLRAGVVVVESTDHDVAATLRFIDGAVEIANGAGEGAHVHVRAQGRALLGLAGAPLRLGFPDALAAEGRAVLGDILHGRVEVRGLFSRLPAVRRLTMLLSAT